MNNNCNPTPRCTTPVLALCEGKRGWFPSTCPALPRRPVHVLLGVLGSTGAHFGALPFPTGGYTAYP